MGKAAQLEDFCRLVEARSEEHREAVNLLLKARHYAVAFGTLRQEIDSLLRVHYLNVISAGESPARARKLVKDLIEGERWTRQSKKGNSVRITDREMLDLRVPNSGWEKTIYEFGCQLIHLSRLHDYETSDPIQLLDDDEKLQIVGYLKQYHAYDQPDLTFDAIIELLPGIINKICDNTISSLNSFKMKLGEKLT